MRAVFLDRASMGEGLDYSDFDAQFSELVSYPASTPEQTAERLQGFDVWITNKVGLTAEHFERNPNVKLVLCCATGVDRIDLNAAKKAGVAVCNVTAYGTPSVGQHAIMLMLTLATQFERYRADVQAGEWGRSPNFCLMDYPVVELAGKTLGLIGKGELGSSVARIAEALGMRVLSWDRTGKGGEGRLPLEQLLPQCQFISIHCPLTDQTRGLLGEKEIALMPRGSYLVNTARGGIFDEAAALAALDSGQLAGLATDVLTQEPPQDDHPMLQPRPNLIVTPHSAWLAIESRQRILKIMVENFQAWTRGEEKCRVA